jgi:hypothetical protein
MENPHALREELAGGVSGARLVPAIKSSNARGYVKFDAVDPQNPKVLIDRKLDLGYEYDASGRPVLKDGQREAFLRQRDALSVNDEYTIRYEVPSQEVADRMRLLAGPILPSGRYEILVVPKVTP